MLIIHIFLLTQEVYRTCCLEQKEAGPHLPASSHLRLSDLDIEAVQPGGQAWPEPSQGCYFWAVRIGGSPGCSRAPLRLESTILFFKAQGYCLSHPNRNLSPSLAASRPPLVFLIPCPFLFQDGARGFTSPFPSARNALPFGVDMHLLPFQPAQISPRGPLCPI